MDAHRSHPTHEIAWSEVADDFVTECSRRVLMSLPRRDQRERGELYVSGLLSLTGRKSMRSIASITGGGAAEQRLHHFISKSSWDWVPVRKALASHLDRALDPRAWVVKPMVVRKAGRHTVGVAESFVPHLGQVVNNQRSYGVWLANDGHSAPVNWRLLLPGDWLGDARRRRRAEIPESVGAGDRASLPAATATATALEIARGWGLRRRPIVMDARDENAVALAGSLSAADVPFVLRISGATRLIGVDAARAGGRVQLATAQRLAEAAGRAGQAMQWMHRAGPGMPPTQVVRAEVMLPPGAGVCGPLLIIGALPPGEPRSQELWLSNMTKVPATVVLRLGGLVERVNRDFSEISTRVGAMDFEGRTFGGWHRHITLSSVAQGIVTLSAVRNKAGDPALGDLQLA
ncbi:transposase [Frankia sp. Cpl3]|nr:transposase [Frankia sp. Cpl3]